MEQRGVIRKEPWGNTNKIHLITEDVPKEREEIENEVQNVKPFTDIKELGEEKKDSYKHRENHSYLCGMFFLKLKKPLIDHGFTSPASPEGPLSWTLL